MPGCWHEAKTTGSGVVAPSSGRGRWAFSTDSDGSKPPGVCRMRRLGERGRIACVQAFRAWPPSSRRRTGNMSKRNSATASSAPSMCTTSRSCGGLRRRRRLPRWPGRRLENRRIGGTRHRGVRRPWSPGSPSMGPRPARFAPVEPGGWWPIISDDSAVVRLAPRVSSPDGPRGRRGRRLCFRRSSPRWLPSGCKTVRTLAASSLPGSPSLSSPPFRSSPLPCPFAVAVAATAERQPAEPLRIDSSTNGN